MQTKSNRPDGGQRNDCTVRALATACGRDYWEVMGVLREAGRKDNQGFHVWKWIEANEGMVLGCLLTKVATYGGHGAYVIGSFGHIRAVVNGIHHDPEAENGRMRPKFAYLVKRNHHPWHPSRNVSAIMED